MSSVCLYFQVHQPWRVKKYSVFNIGEDDKYFNDNSESNLNNEKILHKVSNKCYLPANEALLEILNKHPEFKCTFSITGSVIEQFEKFSPEVLESFKKLVKTGRVEILGETYYHSLAFLYSPKEFKKQVALHNKKIQDVFGVRPRVFRNTELIYRNDIASLVNEMGYEAMLMEGADHILGWRSPAFIYHSKYSPKVKLLLKHYKLSDDIAFRFGERSWEEYPLTAPKFSEWVGAHNGNGQIVNLFMDYETFGEHQWEDTGIFNFLRALPGEILRNKSNDFITPSEAISRYDSIGEIDAENYVSWADIERDLSAWRSNPIQHDALRAIYDLEKDVLETEDQEIINDWRRLQTSDHFYYMCTKWFSDGDVHAYFNPYSSPYDAYTSFMNVVTDLKLRTEKNLKKKPWWITWRRALFTEWYNNLNLRSHLK